MQKADSSRSYMNFLIFISPQKSNLFHLALICIEAGFTHAFHECFIINKAGAAFIHLSHSFHYA